MMQQRLARPDTRRIRLGLLAPQRHIENPTPQKRLATKFAAMLLPTFDGAPRSSGRYLLIREMLERADIEGSGSGARVPVEVEHDP